MTRQEYALKQIEEVLATISEESAREIIIELASRYEIDIMY